MRYFKARINSLSLEVSPKVESFSRYCELVAIEAKQYKSKEKESVILTDPELQKLDQLVAAFAGGQYQVKDDESDEKDIIVLERQYPGYCPICKREHDHIDGYATIDSITGDAYFGCFRSSSGRVLIGKLREENEIKVFGRKVLIPSRTNNSPPVRKSSDQQIVTSLSKAKSLPSYPKKLYPEGKPAKILLLKQTFV
jgi:hypothetical protein